MRVGFEKLIEGQVGGLPAAVSPPRRRDLLWESPGGGVLFRVSDVLSGWMVKAITLDGIEIGMVRWTSARAAVTWRSFSPMGQRGVGVVVGSQRSPAQPLRGDLPGDPTRWQDSSRFVLASRPTAPGNSASTGALRAHLAGRSCPPPNVAESEGLSGCKAAPSRFASEGPAAHHLDRASPTPEALEPV
jgi:hypothetical protein